MTDLERLNFDHALARARRAGWWDGAMWGVGSVTLGIIVVLACI